MMSGSATAIKFCGLKDQASIQVAVALGVDALGFVLYPPSPRAVTEDQLCALCSPIPPFVTRVGLVVNPDVGLVRRVIEARLVDVIQFHGEETGEFCESFCFPYLKALPATPAVCDRSYWLQQCTKYPNAGAFLLDAPHATLRGGTGQTFDWSRWPTEPIERPLIVAGGLTAQNVAAAIEQTHPYAVDVSGGIERERGVKCYQRMAEFVRAVRQADGWCKK